MLLSLFAICSISAFENTEMEHIRNPNCKYLEKFSGSIDYDDLKDDNDFSTDYYFRECEINDVSFSSFKDIPEKMFYGSTVQKVELPGDVETIGTEAFAFCKNLNDINFPTSLTKIGERAFYHSSLGVNNLVINVKQTIGPYAFEGCSFTSSKVTISGNDHTTDISVGKYAFYGTKIQSITITNNNQNRKSVTIDEYAFANCGELTFTEFPTIDQIKKCAFAFCKVSDDQNGISIVSKNIEERAFEKSTCKIRSISPLENGKTITIDKYAFYGHEFTGSLTFGEDCNVIINDYAFQSCTFSSNECKLSILEGTIGPYAFAKSSFKNCELTLTNAEVQMHAFEETTGTLKLITSGIDQLEIGEYAFQNSEVSSSEILHINNDLGAKAFYNCNNLNARLNITGNIGDYAFASCTKLANTIEIHNGNIGRSAFESTDTINRLKITKGTKNTDPNSIDIGERAFYNSNIQCPIVLHSCISTVGEYAFARCTRLSGQDITLYSSTILPHAFAECGSLGKQINIFSEEISFHSFDGSELGPLTISLSPTRSKLIINEQAFYRIHFTGEVEITDKVKINRFAFVSSTFDKSIKIGDSVTIGDYAFARCNTGKISLSIGESEVGKHSFEAFGKGSQGVELKFYGTTETTDRSIGECAFNESGISGDVVIPYTYNLIGNEAFLNCISVTSVTINLGKNPHQDCNEEDENNEKTYNTKSIGDRAFLGSGIKKLVLTSDGAMISIGDAAFYSLNIENEVDIPFSVEYIGTSAFESSTLPNAYFHIDDHTRYIKDSAFKDCTKLGAEIYIPREVCEIGHYAFCNCVKLDRLVLILDGQLEKIGNYSFYNCNNLKGLLDIPYSVTKIGEYAFAKCQQLGDHLSFKSTVKSTEVHILPHAFEDCTGLNRIVQIEINDIINNEDDDGHYHYRIASIGDYAFSGTSITDSFYIPDSLKEVGDYAFGDSKLKTVTCHKDAKLKVVGEAVFKKCTFLDGITFDKDLEFIGNYAFKECILPKITFEENKDNDHEIIIGQEAFYSTMFGENFEFPSKLVLIDDRAFFGSNISKIMFADNCKITTIGEGAFQELKSYDGAGILNSITFPKTVEKISPFAFKKLNIPEGTIIFEEEGTKELVIDESAFEDSKVSESITFPKNLVKINTAAFQNLNVLKGGLTFESDPDKFPNLLIINESAFENSKISESVEFKARSIEIKRNAFKNSNINGGISFEEIEKDDQGLVLEIGESAFEGSHIFDDDDDIEKTGELKFPSYLSVISPNAFKSSKIKCEVIFNSGRYEFEIKEGAFEDSVISKSIEFPSNLKLIGEDAFKKFQLLDGGISFNDPTSDSLQIKPSAFEESYVSEKFEFPSNIVNISLNAFKNSVLKGGMSFEENTKNTGLVIGPSAFQGATISELIPGEVSQEIKLPAYLKVIYQNAFRSSIINGAITFTNSNNKLVIHESAFENATIVDPVRLPSNLVNISQNAFKNSKLNAGISFESSDGDLEIGPSAFEDSVIANDIIEFPKQLFIMKDNAFKDSKIKSIEFEDSCKLGKLGAGAFNGSTIYGTFKVPKSLTIIGANAFENCSRLTSVEFEDRDKDPSPESLIISSEAFINSKVAGELNIPLFVTEIGRSAFRSCPLSAVLIENEDKQNDEDEFKYELKIESYAFEGTTISKLSLPNRLVSVGDYAFANCNYISQKVIIGTGLFGSRVFENSNITELEMSGGYLGQNCLAGCKNFISLTLKGNPTIGYNAFAGFHDSKFSLEIKEKTCAAIFEKRSFYDSSLTGSLYFPAETEIGYEAFASCNYLLGDIRLYATKIADNAFANSTFDGALYVSSNAFTTSGSLLFYQNKFTNSTGIKDLVMEGSQDTTRASDASEIPAYAFAKIPYPLGVLTVLTGIENIGVYAFEGCEIYQIDFQNYQRRLNQPITIGEGAFANCIQMNTTIDLTNVYMNDGIIPPKLFYGCYAIPSVIFPSSLVEIGPEAFYECTNLSFNLDIISGINRFGKGAFTRCKSLSGPLSLSNVELIGEHAFAECTGLHSYLTLHIAATSGINPYIASFAFKDCTGFKDGKLAMIVEENEENPIYTNQYLPYYRYGYFLRIGNEAFENTKFKDVYYNGRFQPDCDYDIGFAHTKGIHTSSNFVNKSFCNYPLHSNKLSGGAIAGIVIAVIVVVVALVVLLVFFIIRMKRKKAKSEDEVEMNVDP